MPDFQATRLSGGVYQSRNAYLKDKAKTPNVDLGMAGGLWLCHAMARAYEPVLRNPEPKAKRVDPDPNETQADPSPNETGGVPEWTLKYKHFPWLTLILGSGCSSELAIKDDVELFQPSAIGAALKGVGRLPDGTDPSALAESFAQSLIEDRLSSWPTPSTYESHQDPNANGKAQDKDARLVLAAAILTRLYHEVAAATGRALRQWGEHRVELATGPQQIPEIRHCWASPLLGLLGGLEPSLTGAVKTLATEIKTQLQKQDVPPTIEYSHVQLLTDYAWHAMAPRAPLYPGWSDLLVHICESSEQTLPVQCPPKPRFRDLNPVASIISDRLKNTTEHSWAAGMDTATGTFYQAVAQVLEAQARMLERCERKISHRPPLVAAFITSFDLELEMALARTKVPGFVVALPVNLYYGPENSRALSLWIGARIKRNGNLNLDSLLKPTDWFVVERTGFAHKEWASWPWVVRLTGSPLLTLPKLVEMGSTSEGLQVDLEELSKLTPGSNAEWQGTLGTEPEQDDGKSREFESGHALLLDEYAAMQQHGTEMLTALPTISRYGLPAQLTQGNNNVAARFWMAMGVQMSDSCIRYRVASRLGSGPQRGPREALMESAGLVVTRHVDAAARDLMQWYGLDVVKSDCLDYVEDLERYRRHLEGAQSHRWCQDCVATPDWDSVEADSRK